ncbi:hypothetical protein ROS217_23207 [Roseovarius sp. 217]|nr:hypothetical protein ROS217_23207 [Roseovarius sp. 217]
MAKPMFHAKSYLARQGQRYRARKRDTFVAADGEFVEFVNRARLVQFALIFQRLYAFRAAEVRPVVIVKAQFAPCAG